ncbi:MAG: helix-turn-helix domain-containing protein [Chloroflexota bacterium]
MSPKLKIPAVALDRRRQAAEIGRRIRLRRQEKGWTQQQVAGQRFTKAYISALETGAAVPSLPSLEFISSQLGVPPDWFLAPRQDGEPVALPARIDGIRFADGRVYADLDDGRALGLPLSRSRKLMTARVDQLDGWEIADYGRAVSWPAIGEEIGLEDFLGLRMLMPADVSDTVTLAEAREKATQAATSRAASGQQKSGRRPAAKLAAAGSRTRRRRASQYDRLVPHLSSQAGSELSMTFDEFERILERPLPPSARRYLAPWSSSVNPLGRALRAAGWRAHTDLGRGVVTLRRR